MSCLHTNGEIVNFLEDTVLYRVFLLYSNLVMFFLFYQIVYQRSQNNEFLLVAVIIALLDPIWRVVGLRRCKVSSNFVKYLRGIEANRLCPKFNF